MLITGSSDDNVVEDKSPSIIQPSIEDPCTLTTPAFDSLPSFQASCSHVECGCTIMGFTSVKEPVKFFFVFSLLCSFYLLF